MRWISVLLLSVSIVPTGIRMGSGLSTVLQGGYSALYEKGATTGIMAGPQALAALFVPASLFLLAGSGGSRSWIILSGVLILVQSSMAMFMGLRYAAVAPLIAYSWVWHRCRKPLSGRFLAAAGSVLILVLIPLMGGIRNTAGAERSSLEFMMDAYFSIEDPLFAALAEMGGTLTTVAYTIDLVPWVRPFEYGAEYLYAGLTVLPNLFWVLHPSAARGTPSEWLVWTVDPVIAAAGGGMGYSFIAEAFLNFGWLGVVFVPLIIGLLYGRFVAWASWSSDPAKIATLASYLSFFLVYARADSFSIMRPLIWYSLFPYLLVRLLDSYLRRPQ